MGEPLGYKLEGLGELARKGLIPDDEDEFHDFRFGEMLSHQVDALCRDFLVVPGDLLREFQGRFLPLCEMRAVLVRWQGGELVPGDPGLHAHGVSDPGHFHTWSGTRQEAGVDDRNNTSEFSKGDAGAADVVVKNTDNKASNISINAAGGSLAHENMPPFYVLAYIMKL